MPPEWARLGLVSAELHRFAQTTMYDLIGDIGHYWLEGGCPELLRRNVACVDWSVAKGGFLCAYQWDGEQKLDAGKFVWIY